MSGPDIVARLLREVDGDAIYDHFIAQRKRTKSDLPRQCLCNEFDLLNEERAEAAATITDLRAEVAALRGLLESETTGSAIERLFVLRWLKEQEEKGRAIALEHPEGSATRASHGAGAFALHRAAEEIEANAHGNPLCAALEPKP